MTHAKIGYSAGCRKLHPQSMFTRIRYSKFVSCPSSHICVLFVFLKKLKNDAVVWASAFGASFDSFWIVPSDGCGAKSMSSVFPASKMISTAVGLCSGQRKRM